MSGILPLIFFFNVLIIGFYPFHWKVTITVKTDTRPVKETAIGLPNKDILGSNETHHDPTEAPFIFDAVPAQER